MFDEEVEDGGALLQGEGERRVAHEFSCGGRIVALARACCCARSPLLFPVDHSCSMVSFTKLRIRYFSFRSSFASSSANLHIVVKSTTNENSLDR